MAALKRRSSTPAKTAVANRIARRERRRERSREEILEAARRVLTRRGIAATTLAAVAEEAGVSKTALYYYFPSKSALLFELIFAAHERQARAIHEAAAGARDGGAALGAIVRASVDAFSPRLDDFRLAFLHGQVAAPGSVHFDEQQFARIRPLNDLMFSGAAGKIAGELGRRAARARVEPRLLAFLAYLSAIGLLTMKGMVESVDDPLAYTDDELIEGFARVFAAAAAP